ncbi:MAG: DUF2085 domain-containing protein [Firmicutes bacterium]|nr:DUF2085 domain-containing protein [Bacillota bacterium]
MVTGIILAVSIRWPSGSILSTALSLLALPCAIDGGLQYFGSIESNNWRRGVTGFLAGIGLHHISLLLDTGLAALL